MEDVARCFLSRTSIWDLPAANDVSTLNFHLAVCALQHSVPFQFGCVSSGVVVSRLYEVCGLVPLGTRRLPSPSRNRVDEAHAGVRCGELWLSCGAAHGSRDTDSLSSRCQLSSIIEVVVVLAQAWRVHPFPPVATRYRVRYAIPGRVFCHPLSPDPSTLPRGQRALLRRAGSCRLALLIVLHTMLRVRLRGTIGLGVRHGSSGRRLHRGGHRTVDDRAGPEAGLELRGRSRRGGQVTYIVLSVLFFVQVRQIVFVCGLVRRTGPMLCCGRTLWRRIRPLFSRACLEVDVLGWVGKRLRESTPLPLLLLFLLRRMVFCWCIMTPWDE